MRGCVVAEGDVLPRLSDKTVDGSSEYYIWSIPGKPVSVHLNLATVRVLTSRAGAGLGTLPRRGLEVGGLLLGRVVNPNPDQYIVSIEKIEPVEIEHVRGPSYILSAGDREELFRVLRKLDKKSEKAFAVVGYYRSHTRPGLYLDEYDHDLMRSYFAHPSCIALLLRPVHDAPAKAGFFFWEDGEIHRASTYREFPLDADLLNPHRSAERPDASAPVISPLPEQISLPPSSVVAISSTSTDVAALPAAALSTVASAKGSDQPRAAGEVAIPPTPAVVNRAPTRGSSQSTTPGEAAISPTPAVGNRVVTKRSGPSATASKAATSPTPPVADRPLSKGRIQPTPAKQAVSHPLPAVADEAPTKGSAEAAPIPPNVQVQPTIREAIVQQFLAGGTKRYMTWTAAAVTLLLVSAALWQPLVQSPSGRAYNVLALNAELSQSGLRLTWDRNNPLLRRQSSATLFITDGQAEKKIILDSSQLRTGAIIYWPTSQDVNFRLQVGEFSESLRALAPKLSPRPEADTPIATDQISQPAIVPVADPNGEQNSARPQTRTRQQEVRHAVLPGEGEQPPARSDEFAPPAPPELAAAAPRLDKPAPTARPAAHPPVTPADIEPVRESGFKRAVSAMLGKGRDKDAFVPARAVRQVPPSLPVNVKVPENTRVSVKVELDDTGRVKGTDLVSRNVDSRLANAAMDAARRWRFEPARQRDRRVESSVILHFRFSREQSGG